MPSSARALLRLGVEVPADLEVVGDEADRADEDVGRRPAPWSAARWSRMSGAEPRLAGRRLATGSRTTSRRRPAASATSRAVSSSCSWYGSPSSRIRAGRRVRGEDDVRARCRGRGRRAARRSRARRASSRRRRARPGRRARPRAAAGSRRSRGASSAARARARRRVVGAGRRARASAASAIRGVQCFIPVKTGSAELGLERRPRLLGDLVQRVRAPRSRAAGSARSGRRAAPAGPAARRGCPRSRPGRPRSGRATRRPSARRQLAQTPVPSPCARGRARRAG